MRCNVCDAVREQPDLKDSGNEQPVPLQILLVVEDMTVSQVCHQCFFCVLNTRHIRAWVSLHLFELLMDSNNHDADDAWWKLMF